jgi:polysaccharide export outer membrane protein
MRAVDPAPQAGNAHSRGRRSIRSLPFVLCALALMSGCAHQFPSSGPNLKEVQASDGSGDAATGVVQLVDIDARVARRLAQQRQFKPFAAIGTSPVDPQQIGKGDVLDIDIWEAPPGTLFGSATPSAGAAAAAGPSTSHATTLPGQMVDAEGTITVPFAGRIPVVGMTPTQVQAEIVKRLKGKAHEPEVLVRVGHSAASSVTVVGEVANSTHVQLTAGGERLLDALAAAGGVRMPVNKMTVQVTRGQEFQSLPLDLIIRDPRQNIALQPGDVVTAISQPMSFTALGATAKNDEIPFEAQGINLAQALARAGGLVDARSNPEGVFVFRMERADALDWPHKPVATTPDGLVPVVYRIDLHDPASFFVMQSFPMNDKDLMYVSNAPVAELQKFLNLVFSLVYPLTNVYSVTR